MLNSFCKCFKNIWFKKDIKTKATILKRIDKNTQGEIILIKYLRKKYIVKLYNKPKIYNREIYFLDKLNNYKIIKREKINITIGSKFGLVLPYYSKGDLYYYLDNNNLSEKQLIDIMIQIAEIIKYIHGVGIIHNDIKLENFLLTKNKKVLLIDLAMSLQLKNINDHSVYKTDDHKYIQLDNHICGGTLDYNAPEKDFYMMGKPSDIWSLGVVYYTLLVKEFPYSYTTKQLYNKLSNKINSNLKNLIIDMLQIEYKKRPNIEDVCLKLQTL